MLARTTSDEKMATMRGHMVQLLTVAREAAEAEPGLDPPPELIEEGICRAARFVVHGELPDAHGNLRPVSELLQDARAPPGPSARAGLC